MTDLAAIITALDEIAMLPPDEGTIADVTDLMEEAVAQPGGMDELIARYADRSEVLLLQPLTFFLARAISKQGSAASAIPTTKLVERLRSDDETVRSNLVTALHLLAIHGALSDRQPHLAAFLEQCLGGSRVLREAAVPAVAAILAVGTLFPTPELSRLRSALEALRDEDPEWVAAALRVDPPSGTG